MDMQTKLDGVCLILGNKRKIRNLKKKFLKS